MPTSYLQDAAAEAVIIPDPIVRGEVWLTIIELLDNLDCLRTDCIITKENMKLIKRLKLEIIFEDLISGRPPHQNIIGLEYAINLEDLEIHRTEVSDLTPISELTKLTRLWLASNKITDISALSELVNLQDIHLADNTVSDLTPLSNLRKLTELRLSNNQITDISPLSDSTTLNLLSLSHNQITDISPLSDSTNIDFLFLNHNQITDISPLSDLTNLELLSLNDNQINDVSPLVTLTNLNTLDIYGNPIKDIQPLFTLLEKNPNIKIYLEGQDILFDENTQYVPPVDDDTQLPPERLPPPIPITMLPSQSVVFSEFMFESEGDLHSKPQWIEVHNTTENSINLKGYTLHFKRLVPKKIDVSVQIQTDFIIPQQQSRLIATTQTDIPRRSDHTTLQPEKVYGLFKYHSSELDQNDGGNRNRLMNTRGFYIDLRNPDASVIDAFGTIESDSKTLLWELPDATVGRRRTSMIRIFDNGIPKSGLSQTGWIKASDTKHIAEGYYYGNAQDIGTPTYRKGKPLPVTLSHFTAHHTQTGVVLKWTTESEIDNAGFYIYRSKTKNGKYSLVNPTIIQGAGTTAKRSEYVYVDTTAKPTTVYYYQIEDVSFAGNRQRFTAIKLRGLISARHKIATQWGKLKEER